MFRTVSDLDFQVCCIVEVFDTTPPATESNPEPKATSRASLILPSDPAFSRLLAVASAARCSLLVRIARLPDRTLHFIPSPAQALPEPVPEPESDDEAEV